MRMNPGKPGSMLQHATSTSGNWRRKRALWSVDYACVSALTGGNPGPVSANKDNYGFLIFPDVKCITE